MRRFTPLLLVTGGKGRLAGSVIPEFAANGWNVLAPGHQELDVTDRRKLTSVLEELRPRAVVNLAAWTDADACEADPVRATLVNGDAVAHLSEACLAVDAHLCHLSSDYVFDGQARRPYREADTPNPISSYGRAKLRGEEMAGPAATIVRVGWLAGRRGRSFVRDVLRASERGGRHSYVIDEVGSPTVTDDVARVVRFLVEARTAGVFHAASRGTASRYELARFVLAAAGADPDTAIPIRTTELAPRRAAPRPAYSALDTSKLHSLGAPKMPAWQDAVSILVRGLWHDHGGPNPNDYADDGLEASSHVA